MLSLFALSPAVPVHKEPTRLIQSTVTWVNPTVSKDTRCTEELWSSCNTAATPGTCKQDGDMPYADAVAKCEAEVGCIGLMYMEHKKDFDEGPGWYMGCGGTTTVTNDGWAVGESPNLDPRTSGAGAWCSPLPVLPAFPRPLRTAALDPHPRSSQAHRCEHRRPLLVGTQDRQVVH